MVALAIAGAQWEVAPLQPLNRRMPEPRLLSSNQLLEVPPVEELVFMINGVTFALTEKLWAR